MVSFARAKQIARRLFFSRLGTTESLGRVALKPAIEKEGMILQYRRSFCISSLVQVSRFGDQSYNRGGGVPF